MQAPPNRLPGAAALLTCLLSLCHAYPDQPAPSDLCEASFLQRGLEVTHRLENVSDILRHKPMEAPLMVERLPAKPREAVPQPRQATEAPERKGEAAKATKEAKANASNMTEAQELLLTQLVAGSLAAESVNTTSVATIINIVVLVMLVLLLFFLCRNNMNLEAAAAEAKADSEKLYEQFESATASRQTRCQQVCC
ncbi:unnamed protein product [Effrenium voratum]|uniref:Uncharacterized protein n=1 Tax=Effrenium voratum TaxID=2562239 RepID=A0AA36J5Z1_9DINO|nr:unnamed protein product [Effrenium voratum]